jgi:katanin p60 ATPase-containing subunit A1
MSSTQTEDGEPKQVTVLAATNFPWDIDDALIRRLEKRIYIPLPDSEGRIQLLNINLNGVKLGDDVSLEGIAEKTEGYSGADITSVCRDAAMMGMRRRIKGLTLEEMRQVAADVKDLPITMEDMNAALQRVSKSVAKEDLKKYVDWMNEFKSV